MKNLPYYKGGAYEIIKNNLSFTGNLKVLEFETFEDFCNRADEILYTFNKYNVDLKLYKKYIYEHKLNEDEKLDISMKDKCFEWIISYEYDEISKNDLYSLLGMAKRGKKWNMNL